MTLRTSMPGHARHHDVEEDEVEALRLDHLQALRPVVRGEDGVAARLEPPREHVAVELVVVHDEQLVRALRGLGDGGPDDEGGGAGRVVELRRRGGGRTLGGGTWRFLRGGGRRQPGRRRDDGGRRFRGRGQLVGDPVDQPQQAARGLPDALEVGRHLGLTRRFRVFVQHLAVADDLVDGRAQVVAQGGSGRVRRIGGRLRLVGGIVGHVGGSGQAAPGPGAAEESGEVAIRCS